MRARCEVVRAVRVEAIVAVMGGGEQSELVRGEAADLSGGDLAYEADDDIRDMGVTGVETCALLISADLSGGQSGEVCGVERTELCRGQAADLGGIQRRDA